MTAAAVLALDQGSHASRACLFDAGGELRAVAAHAVATHRAGEDRVEQDPRELAATLQRAMRECLAQASGLRVHSAGLATQRSSFLCVERASLEPLSPVLSWQDRRNAHWLECLRGEEEAIRRITGLPLSAHYGASKMRWCLDHLPDVQRAARAGTLLFLPLSAWLVATLTGTVPRLDPANASRTLLWNSATLDWSPVLLEHFGIERSMLPDCSPTQAEFGRLADSGAAAGVGLMASTGDQSAVPFFAGAPDLHTACINLGTGAFIQRPLAQRPAAPGPLLGSVLCSGKGGVLYSLEGTVNGAGSAVSAFVRAESREEQPLWQALESLPEDAELPLYVNGVGGLGSPWWRPRVPSRFVGDGDVLRRFAALVESVAIMLAVNFMRMSEAGPPLRRVLVMGGMSRSDWLCRRLAAACGAVVERTVAEATARGAAALAAPDLAHGWSAGCVARYEPATLAGLARRQARLLALLDAEPSSDAKRAST